jgi:hypothetical protein
VTDDALRRVVRDVAQSIKNWSAPNWTERVPQKIARSHHAALLAALDKAPEGAAPRVAVYSEETERDLDTYKWPLGSEKYPTDTAPQSGASAPPVVQHCAGCSGTADLTFKGNEIALPCPGLPVAAPPALSTEEIEEIAAAVEHVQDDGGEWYCMESAIAKRIRDLLARTPKPQGGGT